MDEVGADLALEVVGVPSALIRPSAMMPTRSASSSASSRYWVVRKIVMPCSRFSRRTSAHTDDRLDRVEPGGRLVEEQHLRAVDQRHREVEAALHAARVRVDPIVDRRRRCRPGRSRRPCAARCRAWSGRRAGPGAAASRGRSACRRSRSPAAPRRCAGGSSSGWVSTSNPATVAVPEVMPSSVHSILTVVDLPAPLGPRKP